MHRKKKRTESNGTNVFTSMECLSITERIDHEWSLLIPFISFHKRTSPELHFIFPVQLLTQLTCNEIISYIMSSMPTVYSDTDS
jgi:hypothetical protein